MKIAKFKKIGSTGSDWETIKDELWDTFDDYVRVTEYVDVEFVARDSEEVVQKQLNGLDAAESELRTKFQAALGQIEQRRSELRAITYTPARRADGSVDEYLQ